MEVSTIVQNERNRPLLAMDSAKMKRVFRLVREQWVRSFLLDNDPAEDVKLLMEPVQNMHAISGEHIFTVQLETTGLDQPKMASRWLMMPVLNRDGKILGLYVSEKNEGEVPTLHVVRFIRDDVTGEMCYITDIPETETVEVMHTRAEGRSQTVATYLRFDAQTFRQIIEQPFVNDVSLLQTLSTCCVVTERKLCPICIAINDGVCKCDLIMQPAAHALDFRFFRENTECLLGSFRGQMALSTYRSGHEQSCQHYPVRNITTFETAVFTGELLRSAVQHRIGMMTMNLSNMKISAFSSSQIVPSNTFTTAASKPCNNVSGFSIELSANRAFRHARPPPDVDNLNCATFNAAAELANTIDALMDGNMLNSSKAIASAPTSESLAVVIPDNGQRSSKPPVATLLPRADSAVHELGSPMDKAMLRKIKKREAAERSNNRRHLRRIQLKQALRDAHLKVGSLRKRKDMLEQERNRLKTQLEASFFVTENYDGLSKAPDLLSDQSTAPLSPSRSLDDFFNP